MAGKNENVKKDVSIAVIRRLPKYYRYLEELLKKDVTKISSNELSKMIGFTASQIRQDLNNFGGFGQQGYGYNVEVLHAELAKILGLNRDYNAVIVGAGNLGHAIANYDKFDRAGLKTIGYFDVSEEIVGKELRGIEVLHLDELANFMENNEVEIGIITVPRTQAQSIANVLVEGGAKGLWNFTTQDLEVPEDVLVENVRLNESLYTLFYFLN